MTKNVHTKDFRFNTVALHGGQKPDPNTRSRAVPIFQTTSYVFDDTDHAASLFKMQGEGYIYSRNANPTNTVLEERLAQLEGGVGAFAVASGQAAVTIGLLTLAKVGDEIVATSALYGGTYALFSETFRNFGVTVHFIDGRNFKEIEQSINEKTKAIFTESIGNPNLEIADLEKLSEIAHRHGLPLVVDNTFATPVLLRPIDYGADIVIHSTTKFIGGHGTSIGGAIIDAGKFSWDNDRFPDFTKSKPTLNHRSFVEVANEKAFIAKARFELGHDLGATLSPFNSWLFIQGLESLSVRMNQHVKNAQAVAQYLSKHELVEWVNYPNLLNNSQYELAMKYFPNGVGSIFTFGIKGGLEVAKIFINSLKLLSHLANVGDSKTLIIHPASTTHSRLSPEQLLQAGVTQELIRISIGLEDVRDILADIEQALQISSRVTGTHK
ncbi:O-acetylhomoserine aminocarboxypropyltransferase/cysteine synthase [Schinkia azotoformans]|uniref:O-acetylhomoserine aminocarboxypropyltransferase/cysteine synthase family protein n=1 Tax=Schinkia azotoformans TaxID=1454 RepID=UPI002DBA96F6|nr:O-acetylhomoserine aminocarboxypropyltransferase/cysteine synthase family protein [Schinkia azotoformans]MEC1719426.1 O-acetylhomoserine aminocarboxypropyltransferase/cysteine synthase [Schinkia azotoformans]MED4353432.1 O-acetylhomoserine aminocarboxypropyltransferase/cysteine synthase [Schinkia azotoformans]MED4415564.1 O-acetylhomoserine aminocarboxypropyltransferase/cysteine synthase [Schinkia azotoformans]